MDMNVAGTLVFVKVIPKIFIRLSMREIKIFTILTHLRTKIQHTREILLLLLFRRTLDIPFLLLRLRFLAVSKPLLQFRLHIRHLICHRIHPQRLPLRLIQFRDLVLARHEPAFF
jgi:hypothetical protein